MSETSEKITEFLDNKGINDQFIRNIVSGFINRHTELYGDVIPFESLMERLNTNLDSINLVDPNNKINDPKYANVVGRYEGFKKNSISMFFTQEHLRNPQLREDFIGILIHELTHCAYTIKQNDFYKSEKHIYGTYEELLDGRTPLVSGNNTYMEPIVNHISTRIFGQKNGTYLSQTVNIEKLTRMLDEKEIIKSAFNSDEKEFKECFAVLPEGAYEYYTEGMEWLNGPGEYGFKRGTEIMNNFFNGNIPSLTQKQKQIKELKSLKRSLTSTPDLSKEPQLEQTHIKALKKQGFIDMLLLTLILIMVVATVATITLMFLK
ncbi:MAG: hypothetical protein E7166_05300 [Firmicutes bacterium]|nr:hypothetical protein [Bacillota bacterium]